MRHLGHQGCHFIKATKKANKGQVLGAVIILVIKRLWFSIRSIWNSVFRKNISRKMGLLCLRL